MKLATLSALCLVIPLMSCGSSNNDGQLQQNWTISGATNPSLCDVHKAAQARLVVFDSNLVVQATEFTPCNSFTTTITLPQNTYTSALTFIDTNGAAVSQSRNIGPFVVSNDQLTVLTEDFPVTAFLLQ
jgi:hypothetical protein